MKKFLYILISIIVTIVICEFLSWYVLKQKYQKNCPKGDWSCVQNCNYKFKYEKDSLASTEFREMIDFGDSHKILLFGCSYAYGAGLEPEQTFGYKLARRLNGKLWNRSYPGWTVSHMYYQTQSENKDCNLDDINEDIDTIIYINMADHINRLNSFYWGSVFNNVYNIRYKLKNDKLVKQKVKFPFLHVLFLSKFVHNTIERHQLKNETANYKLFISLLNESHKNLVKKYPKARFIILEYDSYCLNKYRKEIEQTGWELYNTFDFLDGIDLNDEKYHFKNDPHPTEAAWDVIIEKIIEHNII